MNKRELQKQQTRQLIVKTAKDIFLAKGFLGTTTSDISKAAGIAHGTLFLHFPTKEALIIHIFDHDMELISNKMKNLIKEATTLETILKGYLDIMEQDEDLFSTLAREMPNYPKDLRRKFLFRESLIRQHFHQAFEQGVAKGIYKDCNIPVALNFFFGSLNYYLSLKEVYEEDGSVIKRFKDDLINNFIILVRSDNKKTKSNPEE